MRRIERMELLLSALEMNPKIATACPLVDSVMDPRTYLEIQRCHISINFCSFSPSHFSSGMKCCSLFGG